MIHEGDDGASSAIGDGGDLSKLRLDELLRQVVAKAHDVLATQDRLRGLLSGVVSLSEDLSIDTLENRIVEVSRAVVACRGAAMLPRIAGKVSPEILERSRLRVSIRVSGADYLRLELVEPRHPDGFTEDDLQVARVVAAAAGTALENALAFAEQERRERWLVASRENTARILAGATLEESLASVCARALELADAARCTILLPVRREVFKVVAASGDDADNFLGTELPYEETLAAGVMRTGQRMIVEDVSRDPRAIHAHGRRWGTAILVPLKISSTGKAESLEGEVLGVLGVLKREGSPAGPVDELEVITAFAAQASLALEYSRARDDGAHLAVFGDRERIGRDLHDLVIQRIFAIGMTVNSMIGSSTEGEVQTRLGAIVDDLDATIKDIRSTIFGLQHDQGGTDHRVQIRRAIAEATPGLDADSLRVDFVGEVGSAIVESRLPMLIEAVRELLDNVMRHANATEIQVTVDIGSDIRLVVGDDGRGMPTHPSRRVGLSRLEQLANAHGGSLRLLAAEHGTGLVAEWKIPNCDD